jgi:hypothetical protein
MLRYFEGQRAAMAVPILCAIGTTGEYTMDGLRLGPLDRIVVRVQSPDQNISVVLRGRSDLELTFARGAYQYMDERHLGFQLDRLATTTWAAYRRAYLAALSEEIGERVSGESRSLSPRMASYRQAIEALTVRGASTHGWVKAVSVALARWEFAVQRGACSQLDERQIIAEIGSAVRAVLADFDSKVRDIHTEMAAARQARDSWR